MEKKSDNQQPRGILGLGTSLKLARIFGINIFADLSWFIIFLLISYDLSTRVFPSLAPQWSNTLSWTIGIAAAVLFFVSVIIHELSHSLVAKAYGIKVSRIVLFIFGGVADIEKEPPSPGAEFLMALAGPFASVVIGAVSLIGALFLGGVVFGNSLTVGILDTFSPVSGLFFWLGSINIALAIFNLVPGFPLDGGRVLRSIFWKVSGNLVKATRWSSNIGSGIGYTFAAAGVAMIFGVDVPFFGTGFGSGSWMVLIGLFLAAMARQALKETVIHSALENVKVADIMRTNVATFSPALPLNSFLDEELGEDENFTATPVVEDNHCNLVGFISMSDIKKLSNKERKKATLGDVARKSDYYPEISKDAFVHDPLNQILNTSYKQAPVMENNCFVGLVTASDVEQWLVANKVRE